MIPEIPFEKRLLYFEPNAHRYNDNTGSIYTSTTTLIHHYVNPFNKKQEARRLSKQGTGIYKNKSAKQIEAMWNNVTAIACNNGSVKHDYLETNTKVASKFENAVRYLLRLGENNRLYTIDDILEYDYPYTFDLDEFYKTVGSKYKIIYDTIKWYIDRGYEVYAEVGIYHPIFLISGMIDLLVIHRIKKEFVIIDWKTNKDDLMFKAGYYKRDVDSQLTREFVEQNKRMLYPLDNLFDCKGITYSLQLSIYAYMMVVRGYRHIGNILFHIRDSFILNRYAMPKTNKDGTYTIDTTKPERVEHHILSYYEDEVIRLFNYHRDNHIKEKTLKLNM